MTEKRFTHKKWLDDRQLFDNDEPFAIVDVYTQANEICNKLNELTDENEQLKRQIGNLEHTKDFCAEVCADCERLEKENKEIKQLIHTMLVQVDIEKINTKNTRYSARIIFTSKEFKKIQQIWKGDLE